MAKRGGFPGGGGMPGNMANLMKQAQKMQRQMEEQAKAMETKEFVATAGGGAIEVTVTGTKKIQKIKLNEEVVDPDDVEMLEDMIMLAMNDAGKKADADKEKTDAAIKFTNALGLAFQIVDDILDNTTDILLDKHIVWMPCLEDNIIFSMQHFSRHFLSKFVAMSYSRDRKIYHGKTLYDAVLFYLNNISLYYIKKESFLILFS